MESELAHAGRGNRILATVAACGTLVLLGYVVLFCLLQAPPFWYANRPDPVRSLAPALVGPINSLFPERWVQLDRTHNFALVAVPIYVVMTALVTGPVIFLLRRLSRGGALRRSQRRAFLLAAFGFPIALMLVLLLERGLLTTDPYSYVWYSRIWVVEGVSPYTHVPLEFAANDPEGSIFWVFWQKVPSVYGPAWVMLGAACYKVGQFFGGSFSVQLLVLRVLADLAHLLNGWLVWCIAGLMLERRPVLRHPRWRGARAGRIATGNALGLQATALLFYLWNPLVLVEFAGNGHNDAVMLTFVLLALWLHLKGRWPWAALALGVATLVKLPAVMFVPGYLWLLLWEGARAARSGGTAAIVAGAWRGARAMAIMSAAWVVLYIPFWEGPRTLAPLVSGPSNQMYAHSLAAAAWWNAPDLLGNLLGGGHAGFIESVRQFLDANLRLVFLGGMAVVAFVVTWRARTFARMLVAWGWVALATILAQGWFWPWYVTWLVVPAALAPSRRLRAATMVFCVSALLHYIEEQVLAAHFRFFLDWSGVLVMGPPLVYLLATWVVGRGRRVPPVTEPPRKSAPVESAGAA